MIHGNNFMRVIGHCLSEDYRLNTTYAYKWAIIQGYINKPLNLLVDVCIHTAVLDFALFSLFQGEFSVCI